MARKGRRRQEGAKRRATTRAGRAPNQDTGSPYATARRLDACGASPLAGETAADFPLDVMLARGLISREERDEGMRYMMLSHWLYGMPCSGPELLYERMVSGFIDADLCPPRELHLLDAEAAADELERIQRNKRRFERLQRALTAKPRTGYQPMAGTVLEAVRQAAQFLVMPLAVQKLIARKRLLARDLNELARLKAGLERLVALRDGEARAWRKRHMPAIHGSAMAAGA